ADLLSICTYLAPDAIPESFFLQGAYWLGPAFELLLTDRLAFEEAIKVLLSYSLIQRSAHTRTIIVHRLVQIVLKEHFMQTQQRLGRRQVVEAMDHLFPSEKGMQADYFSRGEQLLTHAQACLVQASPCEDDAVTCLSLMNHVATYLFKRADFV